MKPTSALILNAGDSLFRDAVVLGQGLPADKDGVPCRYRWKESLPVASFQDKSGNPHTVTPARIDNLILSFNRAKAKGFLPPILSHHVAGREKRGSDSYGFIVDARKNDKGNLELLHQFIGEDAIVASARNKTSICTVADVTDETGETFDELIDHQALVPDPQLNGLGDFTPAENVTIAIAASRGHAIPAVILSLAADPIQEKPMDLSKLRQAIGADAKADDQAVIDATLAKLGEQTAALTLSRSEAATAKTDAATAKADKEKVALELSRSTVGPSDDVLNGNLQVAEGRLALLLDRGQCTKEQAAMMLSAIKPEGKPSPLMLSRSSYGGGPLDAMFRILELNKAFTGFQQTSAQPVPRTVPGADAPQAVTAEREDYLLTQAGLPPRQR